MVLGSLKGGHESFSEEGMSRCAAQPSVPVRAKQGCDRFLVRRILETMGKAAGPNVFDWMTGRGQH